MVLDTSVLISDPESLFAFPDADAVIPLIVVEELDQHKTRMDDVGRAAREVIRTIEELRIANGGDIRHAGRSCPGGGTLRIETNGLMLDEVAAKGLDPTKADNRILAAALGQRSHGPTVVVSNDAALRIKAAQVGLDAIEHQRRRGRLDDRRPNGWVHLDVSAELIDRLFASPAGVALDELAGFDAEGVRRPGGQPVRRAAGRQPVGAGAPPRSRAGAHRAPHRGLGSAAPLQGAAVRPRPAVRPGGHGGRPRRHGRHGQDAAGAGRRPRAGHGDRAPTTS